MSLSKNPAVRKAYSDGEYIDQRGITWSRGMDGWFDRTNPGMICLAYHHTFVEMIEKENPVTEIDITTK